MEKREGIVSEAGQNLFKVIKYCCTEPTCKEIALCSHRMVLLFSFTISKLIIRVKPTCISARTMLNWVMTLPMAISEFVRNPLIPSAYLAPVFLGSHLSSLVCHSKGFRTWEPVM